MNARFALALLCLLSPLASEEEIRVAVPAASADGFQVEVATSLPPNTCLTMSLLFEETLVAGSQVAVYVGPDGTASKTIGPFPGRALLRGSYGVRVEVDPGNQDPRVQGYYRSRTEPIVTRTQVQVGTPEEAEEDRRTFVKYLSTLVEDCRRKQQEARAAFDELVSGKRFRKQGARPGLDTQAWDQAVLPMLQWQVDRNEEHQRFVAGVVGPAFPDIVLFTAYNYLGGLGLLLREYASRGYAQYKLKPPAQYAIRALIKPDVAVMELMFERDARSILQGIGAQPLRPMSEVSIGAEHVPGGLRLAPVPEALSKAISANPATLGAEELKKVEDLNAAAPGLDLAGAKEVFWTRMETPGEPRAEAEVWIVAYESSQRRADAVSNLVQRIPKDSLDRAFGGEQFLCWVRITGSMEDDVYARLLGVCHDRLGW